MFSTSIDVYISYKYKNYCNWESYNISICLSWSIEVEPKDRQVLVKDFRDPYLNVTE